LECFTGRVEGEAARQFRAIVGWRELEDSVKVFGSSSPLTALCPVLKGIDPDDAFSSIPYGKFDQQSKVCVHVLSLDHHVY
jgi:hypothetical protein